MKVIMQYKYYLKNGIGNVASFKLVSKHRKMMGLTKFIWDSPFQKVMSPRTHHVKILVRTLMYILIVNNAQELDLVTAWGQSG